MVKLTTNCSHKFSPKNYTLQIDLNALMPNSECQSISLLRPPFRFLIKGQVTCYFVMITSNPTQTHEIIYYKRKHLTHP